MRKSNDGLRHMPYLRGPGSECVSLVLPSSSSFCVTLSHQFVSLLIIKCIVTEVLAYCSAYLDGDHRCVSPPPSGILFQNIPAVSSSLSQSLRGHFFALRCLFAVSRIALSGFSYSSTPLVALFVESSYVHCLLVHSSYYSSFSMYRLICLVLISFRLLRLLPILFVLSFLHMPVVDWRALALGFIEIIISLFPAVLHLVDHNFASTFRSKQCDWCLFIILHVCTPFEERKQVLNRKLHFPTYLLSSLNKAFFSNSILWLVCTITSSFQSNK